LASFVKHYSTQNIAERITNNALHVIASFVIRVINRHLQIVLGIERFDATQNVIRIVAADGLLAVAKNFYFASHLDGI
jgi:hypothetical protein